MAQMIGPTPSVASFEKPKAPAVEYGVLNIFIEGSLMVKFSWIWILPISALISGCASEADRRQKVQNYQAKVAACQNAGGTAYRAYGGKYSWDYRVKCISRSNQDRFDRLELACVSAGGTVQYEPAYGYYTNCFKAAPSVNVNNNMSGSQGVINTCVPDLNGDGRCMGGNCC